MNILIVGAGIGGLASALSLHARGIDCELYEQSKDIHELGVGINILPNAVEELAGMGLLEQLDAVGVRTYELIMTNRFGQEIWRDLRGMDAGYGVPQFSIHRGRLQGVLYDAVRTRLGDGKVHLGHSLARVARDGDGVVATFVDRAGEELGAVRADAVVAADGIHSTVRAALYPTEGPPRWNGVMMWRGATDWPAFLTGRSQIIAGGTAAKLVVYPIGPGLSAERRLTNWAVCVQLAQPGTAPPRREDWSRAGRLDDLEPHLGRFTSEHLDVHGLIAATPQFYEYPMCDRDPLPAWTHGRVTLLGDAAHPMYPMGSNGATQAILDARCLARCLAADADVVTALRAYEDERLPPTTQIVHMNRTGGPEAVIDLVEERAPTGFEHLDNAISRDELEAVIQRYSTVTGLTKADRY